jgi:hypothetical protein
MVMEGGFVALGESTRKQVVPVAVDSFLTERTFRWGWGIEEREPEFAASQEPVSIGEEAMVLETAGK